LLLARNGFPTTGFDIGQAKVEMLRKGESYIRQIPGSAIAEQVEKKGFGPQPILPFSKQWPPS
jgi:UDP-N-acetyl-D-mannosaminuronate dehydrogenase